MSGIEEDSFDFPEFLEKENCLPASNSSTTSSIFGTLTNDHFLQSTSQQSAEKIQKPEHLKCSHDLYNSGGRAISPIIEAFREDFDNMDSSSDKIVQNLVTRFENLFDYFERKQHQLNANWENFHKEMAKFNQQKIHEWAKMVDIRFGLQRD
uniref:Biogenesis of lysosome-related organelles complex 1 subunit 5 n=1 Tax=Meloidogyne floridensis TaxID=298350 RepID=A0A915P418_9BILA